MRGRCTKRKSIIYHSYDHGALTVIHSLVKLRYYPDTEPTRDEIWNIETVIERTRDVIYTYAGIATGKIGAKPKAGVLHQMKDGIYWWASRFIPTFFSNFGNWHSLSTSAVYKAAIDNNFETGWREKNNLTDVELDLFWYQLQKKSMVHTGVDNWKQHYVAWVLVWVTSQRPGSFTVAYGYEAGALITRGKFRKIAETLRWSDLAFFRMPVAEGGGIGVTITWRHQKGFRLPHKPKQTSGVKTFVILPLESNRYHQDLALLLLSLAFSRGLFEYENLYELFNGDERNIQQTEAVSGLPVFLASTQAGLIHDEPMHEKALNGKLRAMCDMVGLYGRNTIYAFRRGAIVDTRRKLGTEAAQEQAGQVIGGRSIYSYDEIGQGDQDLANIRAGTKTTGRSTIRELFSQAVAKRVVVDDEGMTGITGATSSEDQSTLVAREANIRANNDPQATKLENDVNTAYSDAKQLVVSKGVDGDFMANRQDIVDQLNGLSDAECIAALAKIDAARLELKTTLRVLRRSLSVMIKAEWLKEAQKSQRQAAGTNRAGSRGQLTEVERNAIRATAQDNPFDQTVQQLRDFDPLTDSGADDDREPHADDDEEGADEADPFGDRTDVTFLTPKGADEQSYTQAGRLEFAKKFASAGLRKKTINNTDLACIECLEDPTVAYEKKALKYNLAKLDLHLKGNFHTREKQIMRAYAIDADGKPPRSLCPICKKSFVAKGFIAHVAHAHPEQISF